MDEIGRDIRSHLAQHSCSSRATQSCLCRRQLLNNSKDGDSTGSLNNLLSHPDCKQVLLDAQEGTSCVRCCYVVFQFQTQPERTLRDLYCCYSREMRDFLIVLSLLLLRRSVVLLFAQ